MELVIRAAQKSDYPRLAEILDHPAVMEQSSQQPYLGLERVTGLFAAQEQNLVLLVAEREGVVEGYTSLHLSAKPRAKHVASFGMAVHPDNHGKGIGSRLLDEVIRLADNWFNLVRLELDVYTDNAAGIHLYKKFGFEVEGELRLAAYKNGKYTGVYKMARIHPGYGQSIR